MGNNGEFGVGWRRAGGAPEGQKGGWCSLLKGAFSARGCTKNPRL